MKKLHDKLFLFNNIIYSCMTINYTYKKLLTNGYLKTIIKSIAKKK